MRLDIEKTRSYSIGSTVDEDGLAASPAIFDIAFTLTETCCLVSFSAAGPFFPSAVYRVAIAVGLLVLTQIDKSEV